MINNSPDRIGEKTISERAFYYMRSRVVDYEDKSGINLFENVLSSSSLQSPHDPDATYRKKGNQARQGYSVSVAETCDPENEIQIVLLQ